MRRFEAQGNDARFMAGSIEQCKAECVDWRDCNVLTSSRYVTGNLLALSNYPAEKFYLGTLPRKQNYDDFVNIVTDACYPGYWSPFEELPSAYPYNFTLYPSIRSQWRRDVGCQHVSGIDLAREVRHLGFWVSGELRDLGRGELSEAALATELRHLRGPWAGHLHGRFRHIVVDHAACF